MRFHTTHHIYKFAVRKKGVWKDFFLREISNAAPTSNAIGEYMIHQLLLAEKWSYTIYWLKTDPSNVISEKKRTTNFFGDVIGYMILFSDKKPIPEMILVSRTKTGQLVMILKNNNWSIGDTEKNK